MVENRRLFGKGWRHAQGSETGHRTGGPEGPPARPPSVRRKKSACRRFRACGSGSETRPLECQRYGQGYPGPAAAVKRWVEKRLGGYVRMSIADRREAVKELAAEGESNRGIAALLGVDEGTVRNAKRAENSAFDADEVSNHAVDSEASAENSAPLSAVAALAADEKVRTGA